MEKNKDFFALEAGSGLFEASDSSIGRITQDLSGKTWKMEKMRVGQGVSEGIHLLKSELSGNNFSWNAAQVPGDVYCSTLDKAAAALRQAARPGDLILTVGAGDIYRAGEKLLAGV